jgi:hypothetical protein
MDGISTGQCPYHRITTRFSPQNAYTSTAALIGCLAAKHYPSTFQNLPTREFQGDLALADRPDSQVISIAYPNVKVGYRYMRATDSYLRLIDGVPEIDPANKQQVFARSIVVMYQTLGIDPNSENDKSRPLVVNVGTGKAIVFQEGVQIAATWKKASGTDLTRFYDASGREIKLVRGEIFIQSLPAKYLVTVA